MSERTDAADRAMDALIDELNRAYTEEAGTTPSVVVDYVLVYAARHYDSDGQAVSTHGIVWPSDNRTSHYAGLGLIGYAKEKIVRVLFDDD